MGLSRPLADAGTLLRYALGESACSVAGPRPELVGRAVPVSVPDRAERGACLDVVLCVGAPPSLQGAVPEVVLAPPTTSRALFPGFTLEPLGDSPLLAFPAGAAPPGLLAAGLLPRGGGAPEGGPPLGARSGPLGGGEGAGGRGRRRGGGLAEKVLVVLLGVELRAQIEVTCPGLGTVALPRLVVGSARRRAPLPPWARISGAGHSPGATRPPGPARQRHSGGP